MSLQYVIDGYNIIKHPLFINELNKKSQDSRAALLDYILRNRLCGSKKNKIIIIFDGYQDSRYPNPDTEIEVIFSRKESADEKIKRIIFESKNVKNIVVVSDDKEIKFFSRSYGATVRGVGDFFKYKYNTKEKAEDSFKAELTYSQMHKINGELRKIWLK
jgi:predicted RNA-binding protein with PIN domain